MTSGDAYAEKCRHDFRGSEGADSAAPEPIAAAEESAFYHYLTNASRFE
jgi:hypothetical protein